ncbi:melanoma-associated antigen B4-like [Nannospalax galili]|uniref:melanoma-associated antigen B4-like n=1 Tax=Nannospalax galili TaxID=1026970 RepID=UPI0004ED0CCF|nr:melanoma-associated antigen B4-like [Nannospalax galili]
MPRGQKSKARAREKRHQIRAEAQGLKDAQAETAKKGESPSCSDQASGDVVPSTSTAGLPQKSQGVVHTTSAGRGVAHRRSGKGAKGQGDENENPSRAPFSFESLKNDLVTKKTRMLMEYMICRYKVNKPIRKGEMLKVINRGFKEQFPDIFKKAAYRLDILFGLELKETQPNGQSYMITSKLEFQDDGSRSSKLDLPNKGILIPLLSVIYLNDYCATEEEVWNFLNMLGVYDEVPHLIFGDIRKLITQDLVQEKYLEYRQVAKSDPPRFEFLWGPRAHAEASKKKVIEFLSHVSKTGSTAYPHNYEEAQKKKKWKAEAESAAQGPTKGKGKGKRKRKGKECPAAKPATEI